MTRPQGLQLRNVSRRFGTTRALDDVSLEVRPGELMSVLGASGSGKSTLLRVVAGLEASEGEVSIGGRSMDGVAPGERGVAFVFQSYALYPHMTVVQNLAAPLVMRELSALDRVPVLGRLAPGGASRRARIAAKVKRTSEMLQIAGLADRRPSQLSGGQQQRVALGRALIREPALFLLDEPLANLDAALRHQTRSELQQLQRRLGTTTLFVTHDQAEAMAISDRIAVMFAGRVRQVAAPDTLYREPADLDVARFLSQPVLNTLPGRSTQAGVMEVAECTVRVDRARPGTGTLAFRPEHARLGGAGAGGLPAVVDRVEHAGSHAHVFATLLRGGWPCAVRVPSETLGQWQPGTAAGLCVDARAAWFFPDAGSGTGPALRRVAAPELV